jgi:hypothetical protein
MDVSQWTPTHHELVIALGLEELNRMQSGAPGISHPLPQCCTDHVRLADNDLGEAEHYLDFVDIIQNCVERPRR